MRNSFSQPVASGKPEQTRTSTRLDVFLNGLLLTLTLAGIATTLYSVFHLMQASSSRLIALVIVSIIVFLVSFASLIVRGSSSIRDAEITDVRAQYDEDEYQSWNSSLGLRLRATEAQLELIRLLFDTASGMDASQSSGGVGPEKRRALLEAMRKCSGSSGVEQERQVLFSALPYSERSLLTGILRALRTLGGAEAAPAITTSMQALDPSNGQGPSVHFEELRYMPYQCRNALQLLTSFYADQETLLRAADEKSAEQKETLLRTASGGETAPQELLRGADGANSSRLEADSSSEAARSAARAEQTREL